MVLSHYSWAIYIYHPESRLVKHTTRTDNGRFHSNEIILMVDLRLYVHTIAVNRLVSIQAT
jgi:hypothetical protein